MSDAPVFTVRPPMRCCAVVKGPPPTICGVEAGWMVPGRHVLEAAFYCDAHRRSDVVPIAVDAPFRRVSLVVEVLFAAAAPTLSAAHTEALARLDLAVRDAGGVLSLQSVTSQVGRFKGQAPAGQARGQRGRGQ